MYIMEGEQVAGEILLILKECRREMGIKSD